MANETFHAPNGDGTVQVKLIDDAWRIVWVKADGTRKVGKSSFATRDDALDTLRANSTRV